MPEDKIKPLKTDALLMPEGEKMLVDSGEQSGEEIPTVIIPTEPIGAAGTNTEPIANSSALEALAQAAPDKTEPEARYWFEYAISGRVFSYAFDPERRTLKICRGADKDGKPIGGIQVLHPSVSRERHATIGCNKGECILKDVESKNGTYVNGVKIEKPYALRNGDKVRFGAAELVYREKKR